ncbi:hypothetical protein Tco_0791044 [Tanacetum coccineum]
MVKSSSSSDSEVYDDTFCSMSCRKSTEKLNTQISNLKEELRSRETDLYYYKLGFSQVEARLVEFKVNETKFCKRVRFLEREVQLKDDKIKYLTKELKNKEIEIEKKEKETVSIDNTLIGYVNATNNMEIMLKEQRPLRILDGIGFNVIPPLPAQVYSPFKKDLSWTGLPKFADDTISDYSRPSPSVDAPKSNSSKPEGNNISISVSNQGKPSGSIMSKPMVKFVKENGCPKINNIKEARKPTVKYAEMYRNTPQRSNPVFNNCGPPIIEDWESETESEVDYTLNLPVRPRISQSKVVEKNETTKSHESHPRVRGNQRNQNGQKSNKLGNNFVMYNKACYICGSFDHLQYTCRQKS